MILKNLIKHIHTMALKKTNKSETTGSFVELPRAVDQKELGAKRVERIPEVDPSEKINVAFKKEDIRGRVASVFLIGFFVVLVGAVIVSALSDGDKVGNLKELLITVSGILAAPLGFVIGYYFRSQEEKE